MDGSSLENDARALPRCVSAAPLSPYRRVAQLAFMLLIFVAPFLDILRFDSATRELIVFGQAWSLGLKQGFYADQSISGAGHVALHFLLKAILPWVVVLSVFPALGYLFGRSFCGWLCPEGALFEWADFLTVKLLGRRSLYGGGRTAAGSSKRARICYGLLAALSAVLIPLCGGVALTGYVVAPKTVWRQIFEGHLTFGVKAGIIGVSIYMLIGSIFVRHVFCKYVCAAGLMQMLFGWVSPVSLRLSMDNARLGECTDCRKCERSCFMNVLPRKNKRDPSCVNCAACIDACNEELRGRGLFSFSTGEGRSAPPRKTCSPSAGRTVAGTKSPGSSSTR